MRSRSHSGADYHHYIRHRSIRHQFFLCRLRCILPTPRDAPCRAVLCFGISCGAINSRAMPAFAGPMFHSKYNSPEEPPHTHTYTRTHAHAAESGSQQSLDPEVDMCSSSASSRSGWVLVGVCVVRRATLGQGPTIDPFDP